MCDIGFNIDPNIFAISLQKYWKNQGLVDEKSYWNSNSSFNQSNYVMSALLVNITYLCCMSRKKGQICSEANIQKLLKGCQVGKSLKGFSSFSVGLGTRTENPKWFVTIGLVDNTDIGIISWRGTITSNEWIADVTTGMTLKKFSTCEEINNDRCSSFSIPGAFKNSGSKIHTKMLEIYNNTYVTYNQKRYSISQIMKDIYPNTRWIITGHSLGAALAELCAADLSARSVKINSVYLFADPSPGNDKYRHIYNDILTNNINDVKLGKITYNITNRNDLVPNSMSNIFWGRKLVGVTKSFNGPKSKSIDTIGLAHNMVESYLKVGVPNFFGKDKTGDITKLSLSSVNDSSGVAAGAARNGVPLYIFILLLLLSLVVVGYILFRANRSGTKFRANR